MTIHDVSWRRYTLPFISLFRTAHGETRHRHGLIVKLTSDDGQSGLGEAAPLSEFGGGDVDRTEVQLRQLARELIGCDVDEVEALLDSRLPRQPDAAALHFALDTAAFDLLAKQRGVRLASLLASNVADAVCVNATIGHPDTLLAAQQAAVAISGGYRTVKLKVGIGGSVSAEVGRVAAVRAAIGRDALLRLDANGAWEPNVAIRTLTALAEFDIELVEQPVAANDLTGLAAVRRAVAIPIAADESVTSLESAKQLIEAHAADILVIKPVVCGGLRVSRRIIELARDAGLAAIVTSSLESGVGVAAALHLASTLPEGSPACGLATTDLLADDLILMPARSHRWRDVSA